MRNSQDCSQPQPQRATARKCRHPREPCGAASSPPVARRRQYGWLLARQAAAGRRAGRWAGRRAGRRGGRRAGRPHWARPEFWARNFTPFCRRGCTKIIGSSACQVPILEQSVILPISRRCSEKFVLPKSVVLRRRNNSLQNTYFAK